MEDRIMKKKVLASFLCAAMATTMLAGCGSSSDADAAAESTESADAEVSVESEELPEAFAHLTFDGDDEGYTAIVQTDNVGDNDGATYGLEATDVSFSYTDGPVGQALYLDGSYGLDLGLEATNTDTYTISFWVNADRLATYGPTLQLGYNIGKNSDNGYNVTWLNVTQCEWGDSTSENAGKEFPIVWSRNVASDAEDGTVCWPWMCAFDDQIYGKREWAMVTIVCSGESQESPLGTTTVGAQYYINGQLVYDSQDNYENGTYFEYTWDATLAPNIMQPGDDTFEAYFGINYWDTVFKGFIDDLYVFDQALTAGQVQSLYELGDASVESVAPEAGDDAEAEEEVAGAFDNSAVEAVGTTLGTSACDDAFWTVFTDVWAVAEGETVTKSFTNYTNGENNWENFLVVLQNVAAGHSAADDENYAEYAVCRADNYGWGTGYEGIATAEGDWNWDTYTADMNGAQIDLTVTNNGGTVDVAFTATTVDGTVYNQSYTGIAVDGDVYFCLTLEKAFLNDIQ
jgi:hypothetical protein